MSRLTLPFGRAIDRAKPIAFGFEGQRYTGFEGDTIAAALWSAGVRTISRSFKYKRRRGVMSFTGFDGATLVQVGPEPNIPADRLPLARGLPSIAGQNYSGSLDRDWSAWVGWFGRFMPVGFYYRTFFRPRWAWKVFEPIIRRRAGLGKLTADKSHPPETDKQYLFCDVCVIGAGPAGLAAAREAATHGAEVLVIEADRQVGGSLALEPPETHPGADALVAGVPAGNGIRVITSAVAQGIYADNWLAVETRERLYKVRAGRIIVATGTFEQPIVFRNNDLPGVMLSSAARRLLWQYGVAPGQRAVICTSNNDGLRTALHLVQSGIEVAFVADAREPAARNALHTRLSELGIEVALRTVPYEAIAKRAPMAFYFGSKLSAVRLAGLSGPSQQAVPGRTIECDLLCLSGGFVPAAALACHAGARLTFDDARQTLAVIDVPSGMELAGSINGAAGIDDAISDGVAAGRAAAAALGLCEPDATPRRMPESGPAWLCPIVEHPRGKEFVDFDEDLTIADIRNGVADGFTHMELLKRYSTAGMGPSQGKFSALATVRVAADALGLSPSQLGTTTLRPPFTGSSFRLLAGRGFSPYRRTPMHDRHLALGAQMMVAGTWHRPAYYGKPEDQVRAIQSEVRAVRERVGMIDVSTLGGIEISGPDAAAFINRVYTTPHLKQPVGRSRYLLLCDAGGAIVDDGVACRLGENRFYLTATTSAVDQTYRTFLWLNAQWQMRIDILNVTSAFSAVNVAGPQARAVLQRLGTDVDLSSESFPYLEVRVGKVDGIPARLIRVGFVGELGYEIHVPTPNALALWDRLMEAGQADGIVAFGVEAQRVLRLEKGHIIVGQDSDGLTHPFEAGLDWAVPKNKTEYVGKTAVDYQMAGGLRRKLVGFKLDDSRAAPPAECCLVLRGGAIVGRVTSAINSETCGGVVGLAFVAAENSEFGATFTIKSTDGQMVTAHVVPIPFYDPKNERQAL
jgi:sarcosine oxidase subunit alpha